MCAFPLGSVCTVVCAASYRTRRRIVSLTGFTESAVLGTYGNEAHCAPQRSVQTFSAVFSWCPCCPLVCCATTKVVVSVRSPSISRRSRCQKRLAFCVADVPASFRAHRGRQVLRYKSGKAQRPSWRSAPVHTKPYVEKKSEFEFARPRCLTLYPLHTRYAAPE